MVGPGLHFKVPFGVEKNYNVPTQRILKEEFGFRTLESNVVSTFSNQDFSSESIMLTGDLNIIDVEWIIQYQITDARAWLFGVDNQEKTIRDISQSVINMLVGDRTIFDVIGAERANIEVQGADLMNDLYKSYGLGIRVTTVKLQNIVPPKGAVQDAFEDVNKAIQDRSRLINEGKEAYNQSIPRASGQADQTIQESQGYATERVNQARGDVSRFLAVLGEYRQAPDVVRTRLYYEMYDQVFSGSEGTDLIDKNLKNFLPLKGMGGGSTPTAPLQAPTPSAPNLTAPNPPAPAAPAAPSAQGGTQ
jgi:membrane protease subunit HflK